MSDENKYSANISIFDALAMTADSAASPIIIGGVSRVFFTITTSSFAGGTGTVTISISADNSNWASLDTISITGNGTTYKNYADLGAAYMKLVYTQSSVTAGTLTVKGSTKTL